MVCVKRLGSLKKVKSPEDVVKSLLKGLDDGNRDVRTFSRDALSVLHTGSRQELIRSAERAQPGKGEKRIQQIFA